MRSSTFAVLSSLIAERTGIVIRQEKEYLLEARLAPVCRAHQLENIDALAIAILRNASESLVEDILDAMTTNETSFFRDALPFEALAREVLPDLVRARSGVKRLRIWSAACSSGQEIYSLAMLLIERFPELSSWRVEMLATDVSPSMVVRCRSGSYSRHEISRGLSQARIDRHFFRAGENEYLVDPRLTRWVSVRQHNLLDQLQTEDPFDLIVLRNVLIYFSPEVRTQVLSRLHGMLARDGYLMLGTAEQPGMDSFERADVGGTSFFRRTDPRAA